jgi:hypothetical protein
MRRMLGVVAVALLVPAVGATAATEHYIDVPGSLEKVLPKVKKRTHVAVLFPYTLVTSTKKVYASGSGRRDGWDIELAAAPHCGGANACFEALFSARRGGHLPSGTRVRLRGGIAGTYRAMSCGASCAPANIWFRRKGVLYQFQFKPLSRSKATMVRLADEALGAGPR